MAFVDARAEYNVILWDDLEQRTFEKVTMDNKQKVLAVHLLRDYMVVLQENKVVLYTFPDLTPDKVLDTAGNSFEALGVSCLGTPPIVVYPHPAADKEGQLSYAIASKTENESR